MSILILPQYQKKKYQKIEENIYIKSIILTDIVATQS